jgi:hypothetical protein
MALAITGASGNSGIVQQGDVVARWVSRVQAADGLALEPAVISAVETFVAGCIADASPVPGVSNWGAMNAVVLLMGARTLAGSLVPLKGPAPANTGFVSGDYNRTTGLVGDAVGKRLNSGYSNNATSQDSRHVSVLATIPDSGNRVMVGFRVAGTGVELRQNGQHYLSSTPVLTNPSPPLSVPTFVGLNRQASDRYVYRANSTNTENIISSVSQPAGDVWIFTRTDFAIPSNARIAFYSLGAAVDLAALQARVQTLRGAISAGLA